MLRKNEDVILWAVLVAIILWATFKFPMFVIGIAIIIGIWKWFSQPKSKE